MSPAAGGGDRGGEAWSKRDGRWGAQRSSPRGKRMARRREDGSAVTVRSASVDTRLGKDRRGTTECSTHAREGGREGKEKGG
jgi:hypothetical protein